MIPEKYNYYTPEQNFPVLRNLFEESKNPRTNVNNFLWYETWDWNDFDSDGCIYCVGGLRIKENDIIVDIGANIGLWTNRALQSGAKKIIAIEPVKINYICLLLNTLHSNKIECFNLAISDRITNSNININPNLNDNIGASLLKLDDEKYYTEKVITVTLDWLFDIGLIDKIDFLKIDCEGCEDQIILNLSKERLSKINSIAIEYHTHINSIMNWEDCCKRLILSGFRQLFHLHLAIDNTEILTFSR